MKIWHKAITRQIEVEPYKLMNKVSSSLTEKGYTIYYINGKEIKFRYNIWEFGSGASALYKIDGGEFVIEEGIRMKITFSYYTLPIIEILLSLVSLYLMFYIDHLFIILIIFLAIFFILRLAIAKIIAQHMMDYFLQFPDAKY